MGGSSPEIMGNVSRIESPPTAREFEVTLLGSRSGYGESIVLRVGEKSWAVVDSFLDTNRVPVAMRYLETIGVDPAGSISFVVATHWHDDHIRGLANILESSPEAQFCCAAALTKKEFMTLVGALEGNPFSTAGSGLSELHKVFSLLGERGKSPSLALPNRLVLRQNFCNQNFCKIWSLSPSDAEFKRFLQVIGREIRREDAPKKRLVSSDPNEIAVALWVDIGEFALLLGADLEKRGWTEILQSKERPSGLASIIKIPHHGSKNADEPGVWHCMLQPKPIAVLAPWCRGRGVLPTSEDVKRILGRTPSAYATASHIVREPQIHQENQIVTQTLRESGIAFRDLASLPGVVRLRRELDQGEWNIETFGNAGRLVDYAA